MRHRIYFIVLIICIAGFCNSQNFAPRLFSKAEGLPDAYTYSIAQDTTGFLWISSGKHLLKFDGQFFKDVRTGLPNEDIIYASTALKDGTLWFGTSTGKLISVDSKDEKAILFNKECKASINKILSSSFTEDLFINTTGNGVFIKRKNELIQVEGSDGYEINGIEELSQDLLLLATSEGLMTLDLKTKNYSLFENSKGDVKGIQRLKQKPSAFVFYNSKGDFFEVEIKGSQVLKTTKLFSLEGSPQTVSNFVFNEKDQILFIATEQEELLIYNLNKKSIQTLQGTAFSAAVNSFFIDSEENIWITTIGKGLYRLTQLPYDYLNKDAVFAITEDGRNKMYYGTANGIVVYDEKGAFIEHIQRIGNRLIGKVNALCADEQNLWIGTQENGLMVANLTNLKEVPVQFSEIKDVSINSISKSEDYILVTTNLDGVYNYKKNVLQDHFSVKNSLLHNNVYHSILSKSGKIYYATHNTAFNYSSDHQLFEISTKELGLMSDFNAFAQTDEGEIYIATHGDGIYVLKDTSIRPFEFNGAIDSDFCGGIFYDKTHLWIITQYHLYKFYIKDRVLREMKLGENEQLIFNRLAFYRNKRNDVFLGTDKGVIHFNADHKNDRLALPYLLKISVGDSILKDLNKDFFSNGVYNFSFEFSALALKNSEELEFSYKLEGRDEHWSDKSVMRKAEFSKLGEGEYIFKVIAYNNEGFASGEIELYRFTIDHPYWKKAWFWIITAITLIILITSIIRTRTKHLIKAKETLEQLVEEKTKQLREEKELVEKSNIRIEEQSQEIRDSITYAKRIQDALLPDKEQITSRSQNLFVLYQPRDIVSGDFYWGAEVNKLKFVAAADCTGHGVPGSLMSMIGTTILNKIVLERKILRPKDILKELDKEIRNTLKQHTETATRDGMDICLCCIDTERRMLIYAGALRPLFFVRDRQLTEYSPTKNSIGGFNYEKGREYEETEIELHRKDTFYLFSDGYADQFGGEKGKKLMVKNFKKLLVSISDMELPKQEENLRRVYNNWKGDLDQVDDVLVIGIRI